MRYMPCMWLSLALVSGAWAGTWSDDFADAAAVDWEGAGQPVDWIEKEGTLNGELIDSDVWAFRLTGDDGWGDYSATCSANVQNLAGGDWTGIVFRYQDEQTYAWFGLSVAWTQFAAGVAGNNLVQEEMKIGFRQWYTLRAEIEGANAQLYVDEEPLLHIEAAVPPSGKVGVFSARSLPQFDDFRIVGANIPDGGPGFAVTTTGKLATVWASIRRSP